MADVDKIAAEAHEQFGLKIPAILEAETEGEVAVTLRLAVRDDPESKLAGEALNYLASRKLRGAHGQHL